ncbi:MAG: BTAD domain-containing putative transcriptional regulator [Anaerolineae bacterium]|nr:BTAD domain-containing putative transcriptional regulator [Anaerolineae bacterium]
METPSIDSLIDESWSLEQSGDLPAALQYARRALELARTAGESEHLAAALLAVARVRFRLGQYDAAKALAAEALSWCASDSPHRADALIRLGSCAADTNALAEAEALYLQAAEVGREIGYALALVQALHGLAAGVYIPSGRLALALAADAEAYRITSERGLGELRYFPLMTMAWTLMTIGHSERAHQLLGELELIASPGSWIEGYYCWLAGDLALYEGYPERALALYTRGRSIAEETGEHRLTVAIRVGMSRYHRATGDGPNARVWANDAVEHAARLDYHHAFGKALIERARAAWLCHDLAAAEADLHAAIEVLAPLPANLDLAHANLLLAALLHQQERAGADSVWLEAVSRIVSGGYVFLLEQERALAFPLLASSLNSADSHVVGLTRRLLSHLARIPPPPLRVHTLGQFEVWQSRRLVDTHMLRQRRAGELLVLLLITPGHTLSLEQLAEALCPERPPDAARTFFHHATSALRRALEPDLPEKFPSRYLEVKEGRVILHLPSNSWIDIEAFEAHCRRGEWEEALCLYSGDFLPAYRYADWTIAPRERLTLLYQQALLEAAQVRLAANQFAEALEACRRLLALEPWHEEAVLLGMRACVALNDLASARRLYLALEKALQEDLDTAPRKELQMFYRSLTPSTVP